MSNRNSRFDALDEFPFLSTTNILDDPLEKELWDYDTLTGLHEISSDMIKNNAIASAFAMSHVNAFMGGSISTSILGADSIAKPFEKILSNNGNLDINKLYSLDMIMEYIVFMTFKKGDVLLHTPFVKNSGEIETTVELIDAGRIKTPLDLTRDINIRNGVKYSAGGRIEGFYIIPLEAILNRRGLNKNDYDFIPLYTKGKFGVIRQNCLLNKSPLFDEAGASRAIPPLIPSSKILRHCVKYIEAVVIGAHVAACFAGFITTNNAPGSKKGFEKNDRELKQIGKVSPGGIYFLRKGEEISFGSPSRPADNTDSFVKRMTLISAASLRFPYEMSMLHLENTSFSSWKGGATEVQQNQNRWVNRLTACCNFIYNNILQEAIIKGMIRNSSNIRFNFDFPKFNPLDDEKKARANSIELGNETTSIHKVCSESNSNYDDIQEQIEKEAMDRLERQARMVVKAKGLEDHLGIILPNDSPNVAKKEFEEEKSPNVGEENKRDTTGSRRKGEQTEKPLTPEEKSERRKQDGNF